MDINWGSQMGLDKFSLKGKAGIVTGASRGLGKGIATALAQAGADLVIKTAPTSEYVLATAPAERQFTPKS